MSDTAPVLALDSVAHLLRPWGTPAFDLEELHLQLADAPPSVLFTHVLYSHLRHAAAEVLPTDDISAWVAISLQDPETAERLSFAVQPPLAGPEVARERLRGILGGLSEKRRRERRAPDGGGLTLLAATSVRFPTGIELTDVRELEEGMRQAGITTWFLYLFEEPWFGEGHSALLDWVERTGDERLVRELREVAECGVPLGRARSRLQRRLRMRHLAGRVAEAALAPDHVRRASAHEAAVRLARRATDSGQPS